jgi:hypothetical protein
MPPTDNLLLELHRWAHNQDENFTTESFAHLLKHLIKDAPNSVGGLFRTLTGVSLPEEGRKEAVISTQVHTMYGTPDISICLDGITIYVEVKVEAALADGQAEGYLSALEELASSNEVTQLALLTKYPAPATVSSEVHKVRWFEIIDELEKLELEEFSEVTKFLVSQFIEFLTARGMAIPKIRSGVSSGVRSYLSRVGDASIFTTGAYRTTGRLLEESELVPLHDLLLLMALAIEQAGVSHNSVRFGSGHSVGGWLGWNIDGLRCHFHVCVASPDTIVYETYKIDPAKHDGVIGRVFEGKGLWTWDNSLDLASDDLNFYDLDKSEQIDLLVDFVRKSDEIVCEFKRQDMKSGTPRIKSFT